MMVRQMLVRTKPWIASLLLLASPGIAARAGTIFVDGANPNCPGTVVTFRSGEASDSVLDGFTVTNGSGGDCFFGARCGGGILVNNSSPTLVNNTITRNNGSRGGGIFAHNSAPTIANNTIS